MFLSITILITGFLFEKNKNSVGTIKEEVPTNVLSWFDNWERPDIPPKIALQIGHLNSDKHPDELQNLRNNTGARYKDITETQVNENIALATANILKNSGVDVQILDAVVTPNYWADAFVAIHADGSDDVSKSGFKISGPWRDFTEDSDKLAHFITLEYEQNINMEWDSNITTNMRGYYAFSWWKYKHSIHPMTTGVIVETGFLTNAHDRSIIVDQPELVASAIANGILNYLRDEGLI